MNLEEYQKRDYRVKCQHCGRWMKYNITEKTPVRRSATNGNYCVVCEHLDHTSHFELVGRLY